MKVKLQTVTSSGDCAIRIPKDVLKAVGWREGDVLSMDVPMTGTGVLIVSKGDNKPTGVVYTGASDKSRVVK